MRTPHALVRACRPTTPPRSRPSRLLARLLARLPPGEPDETVHSPSTRLAVALTTEPAAGRSTRTPWRTPRHASHYAAMTTQHSAHPPLPSAASLSLSISPLSFASTSLASFVPRLQWRAHKGCLGSDVSGTWWERTLTLPSFSLWTRITIRVGRALFHRSYTKRYRRMRRISPRDVQPWMLPIAVARLGENITAERDQLIAFIDQVAESKLLGASR